MKRSFAPIHRTISIGFALIWAIQALTGSLLVFHREIDAFFLSASTSSVDFEAVDKALQSLTSQQRGSSVPFVYAADESFSGFDAYLVDEIGNYSVLRMGGDGRVVRTLPSNPEVMDAGFFELLLELHTKLWSGNVGHVLIGISGILLLTNMILGLMLAWPRRGQWRAAFRAPKKKSNKAGLYALHRMTGLMAVVPAFLIIGSGTLMLWEDNVADMLGGHSESPNVQPLEAFTGQEISLSSAIEVAQARFPGAKVSIFTMATPEKPYYRIRLLQADELRSIYGKTTVYVSAEDGNIFAEEDGLKMSPKKTFLNSFFPIHNGEAFGFAGRVLTFVISLWLITMIVFGLRLWWLKR